MPDPQASGPNPYAPPASEPGLPMAEAVPSMKRPASVKWAIAFLILGLIGFCSINGSLIVRNGWDYFVEAYRLYPYSTIVPAIRIVALFVILFGGRTPVAYWAGVLALGATLCELPANFQIQFAMALAARELFLRVLEMLVPICLTLLLVWLCYSFTFGKPSRQYFRLI
jgi:hypothetical protein